MPRQTVTYYSEGHVIAADLFTLGDAEATKRPAIVLCQGFTGIRTVPTFHDWGERLVKAGYVALSFDYRGFGDSGGERGRLAPLDQVDDIRNSVTFLEHHSLVDATRIGVFGTSYGCLTASHAASVDPRIKACLAILGVATGYQAVTNLRTPDQMMEWERKVAQARRRRVLFNEIERNVPVGSVFLDKQSQAFVPMLWEYSESFRNPIGFDSIGRVMDHRPLDFVHKIAPRAYGVFGAKHDESGDPKSLRELYDAAREPKRWIEFDCGHYDMYQGEQLETLMKEVIRFFNDYV